MRAVGIIIGFLIALAGLTPVLLGVGIVGYVKDLSPLSVPLAGFEAPPEAVAVLSPAFTIDAETLPSQIRAASVTVRITPASPNDGLFLGLARATDLRPYLEPAPTAVLELRDTETGASTDPSLNADAPDVQLLIRDQELQVALIPVAGTGTATRVAPPATRDFWLRQVTIDRTGDVTVTVDELTGQDTRIVLMREDGRPGIGASADARFRLPVLMTIGWWLLGIGAVLVLGGLALALALILRGGRATPPADPTTPVAAGVEPAAAPPPGPDHRPAVDTEPLAPRPPDAA